jgi:class 3 adenylate cyclase/predicted ATPase
MTFDDILAQIIDLLKRQGRVSYSALKRRFDLDDDYLNDLKDELLFAHPVVDEDNRGLVWTGETASGPEVATPSAQTIQQPVTQGQQSAQVTPRITASPPDAERRQLTVMFCDLVDSTALSGQLDPEDLREVVRAYQSTCTEVIQRFDGYVAQLLGDGLLVYFGYPHAHEDDPQRAVRTGLGILAALGDLNTRLQQEKGIQLALHMGIHTGLVVIGEMGSGGRQEQLALGETPNVAARIQGAAAPNTLVISDATSRLVQGYFVCQDLRVQSLRGVAEPVAVYRVLSESGATSRLDVAQPRGLTPLVGRDQEVGLLLERWEQAKSCQGQVVLLSGDAGIGKSRLVQMLKDHVTQEPHTCWECRSAEYYQNTALFPLTDLFQRILRFDAHETADTKLEKLTHALSQYRLPLEESVQLFAPLLSLPISEDTYPPLQLSPQRQRQKALETLVAILQELAEHQPVLFILEDLHWTDPTTLELLTLVIEQIPTTSILTVLTCRPHFQPAWHHRSYSTEITLNRLSPTQVEQIVTRMTDGKTFPAEVLQQILEKTDGVPLYVEEMTKAILESGQLKAVDGHYALTGSFSTFAIPATLQDSLMARLDRLVTAKAVAQYAAVIGRQFSYELLQAVSQVDEVILQHELGRLVEAEIVYHRGVPPQATYTFKHALIQDAAYQSLLRSTRQQYHQRIAQIVEAQFPETAEAEPELLAYHYTAAGLTEQAVHYWQHAGQHALQRSANQEAVQHLTTGLALLARLPETPTRAQQELDLQIALGPALAATKGHAAPEVETTYARARELCQRMGDTPQVFPVLWGLWLFYDSRGELQTSHELGERLLTMAQFVQDPALLLQAHHTLGVTSFNLGEFAPAQAHFEHGIALYHPQQHRSHAVLYGGHDPGVCCLSQGACVLWFLGYPDRALQRMHEALTLGQELAHPHSLAIALHFAAELHQLRREGQAAQERAEMEIALSGEQGSAQWLARGTILRGWALAWQGQGAEGLAQMCQGLSAFRATGAEGRRTCFLALLAEGYRGTGEVQEGLRVLAEALAAAHNRGEHYCEAELHRLTGELLLLQSADQHAEAEACFHQALAIARRQQAKSWELRAAMSLSRLWQQHGKQAEARALLAPIYGWFTEGFETADLQEAKALLDALA